MKSIDMINKKDSETYKNKLKRAFFILAMVFVPLLNFLVFYIYVDFNSILMAFQKSNMYGEVIYTLEWFKLVIEGIFVKKDILIYLRNTMYYFCTSLFILMPLTALIAYFIYKKIFMYKFFRVVFFLPSIFSTVVLVTIYKNIMGIEGPIAQLFAQINNLDAIPDFFNSRKYATGAILLYCVWTGFGTNLILMIGAMTRIPEDVLEAAQLDGISWGRELVSIIIPLIWPTFTTLIVMTFVGIFTSSGPILLFTRGEWDTSTLSYFIFQQVYFGGGNQEYAAAVGIFFTVLAVPIILTVKKLMERWQDAVEY